MKKYLIRRINYFIKGNKKSMLKKFGITFFVLFIIIATIFLASLKSEVQTLNYKNDYLRIHVRANSNATADQQVKYTVKEKVVQFLTPHIKDCTTKENAVSVMSGLTREIEEVCDNELKNNGFYYGATVSVRQENFPTRVYEELTLQEGIYDALIIELGTGKGDNWWCVIYPPLCFMSASSSVEYRSLIYDIINKFINN